MAKKPGFSLIELLISSALISFLLAGTAELLVFSLAAKKKAEFHIAAASLACSKLEYFKSLPFESAELKEGESAELIEQKMALTALRSEWVIENVDDGLKKVVMTIFALTDPDKKATFSLLLSRELEF